MRNYRDEVRALSEEYAYYETLEVEFFMAGLDFDRFAEVLREFKLNGENDKIVKHTEDGYFVDLRDVLCEALNCQSCDVDIALEAHLENLVDEKLGKDADDEAFEAEYCEMLDRFEAEYYNCYSEHDSNYWYEERFNSY